MKTKKKRTKTRTHLKFQSAKVVEERARIWSKRKEELVRTKERKERKNEKNEKTKQKKNEKKTYFFFLPILRRFYNLTEEPKPGPKKKQIRTKWKRKKRERKTRTHLKFQALKLSKKEPGSNLRGKEELVRMKERKERKN